MTRFPRLVLGLFLYGIAIALLLRSGLGSSPWDVLSQGVARVTGLSFGATTVAVSIVVLALWIPLRQRPGWGTLFNTLLIGPFADLGLGLIPAAQGLAWQAAALACGLILLAVASALYIGAGLGPGPRDGLMTGLVARTGRRVWVVRSAIELSVVALGWLLGGPVGIGTAVFAFGIGPLIQAAMWALRVDLAGGGRRTVQDRPASAAAGCEGDAEELGVREAAAGVSGASGR